MKKLAIIAALEREVRPLVQGWKAVEVKTQNRRVRIFESQTALVAVAGIGTINARIAAGAVYEYAQHGVGQFVSAGLAGALIPEFEVGEIFSPGLVVDAVDAGQIRTASGEGTLVTASSVADMNAKRSLADRFRARAVDMEAYAVADVARIYGVPFVAVKAISDPLEFPMPPLSRFVTETGQFQTGQFAVYAAVRPWLWSTVSALGRNSAVATKKLCEHLGQRISQHAAGLYNDSEPVRPAGA
jgi:adenosylhomocysteine nucleosidase